MKIGLLLDLNYQSLVWGGDKLEWVNDVKYFGFVFNAVEKLPVDVNFRCRKLLGASLAILQKFKYLLHRTNIMQVNFDKLFA